MGEIYDFDNNNSNSELLIENEIKRQELILKDSIWYHGIAGRVDAENRITNNGEFLVRFSPEVESKFVVSTKWNGKFIHTIIKTEINMENNQLVYFINDKFKFVSVLELILFHKENQYPMSETSGVVLFKPVDPNNIKNNGFAGTHRESKFRKSTNMFRKHGDKRSIPRSGSETYLTNKRYSDNYPELNKSLTNLSTHDYDAPNKPKKPSFKLLNSKHLLLKLRPSNIKIRNKKLYKDSGDYSDYSQVKDTDDAMKRERMRRGLSLENRSPSLFGLNTLKMQKEKKKHSIDSSIYVTPKDMDNKFFSCYSEDINSSVYVTPRHMGNSFLHVNIDDRQSTKTLTANTPVTSTEKFDVYGFDRLKSPIVVTPRKFCSPQFLGLPSFVNFSLSSYQIPCCGPVESTFDKVAINKLSTYLISDENFHLVFCKHLLDELLRIFEETSTLFYNWNAGYRWIFLPHSDQFRRDLAIRQTALGHFIMATIVSTISTEKRISLIFFWIKCADYLLTHTRDMFHFTAVFSAIFSDQILSLRVWKIVHRQDPLTKHRMEALKEAIKNGCLMRTDIDQCVPDLVQLDHVFFGNEDDLDVASKISFNVATWSDQAFLSHSSWLIKIMNELDSKSVIPYFREMVRTETLLCMIFGHRSISFNDMTPLFAKMNDCIRMMAKSINENHI